jgi:outer membrane protein assembly factor BamB
MTKFICLLIATLLLTAPGRTIWAGEALVLGQEQALLSRPLYLHWSVETSDLVYLTPAADGEKVFLTQAGGNIFSLNPTDGTLSWKSEIGGEVSAAPVADRKGIYVASETTPSQDNSFYHATGVLRMLGSVSGVTLWMRTLAAPIRGALVLDGNAIFGCTSEGQLYAIKKASGEVAWADYVPGGFAPAPIVYEKDLYICDHTGNIYSIDKITGRTNWRYRTQKSLRTPIAFVEGTLYSGSGDGSVYAINVSTRRLKWRIRTGAAIQSLAPAGKCLLATSLDNFAYCLSPESGAKLWKRQLAGRIEAQPLVLGDTVLLSPISGDESVILNLEDGKKVNSVYVGEDNNTEASPTVVRNLLLLPTRKGLFAYANQSGEPFDSSGSNPRRPSR